VTVAARKRAGAARAQATRGDGWSRRAAAAVRRSRLPRHDDGRARGGRAASPCRRSTWPSAARPRCFASGVGRAAGRSARRVDEALAAAPDGPVALARHVDLTTAAVERRHPLDACAAGRGGRPGARRAAGHRAGGGARRPRRARSTSSPSTRASPWTCRLQRATDVLATLLAPEDVRPARRAAGLDHAGLGGVGAAAPRGRPVPGPERSSQRAGGNCRGRRPDAGADWRRVHLDGHARAGPDRASDGRGRRRPGSRLVAFGDHPEAAAQAAETAGPPRRGHEARAIEPAGGGRVPGSGGRRARPTRRRCWSERWRSCGSTSRAGGGVRRAAGLVAHPRFAAPGAGDALPRRSGTARPPPTASWPPAASWAAPTPPRAGSARSWAATRSRSSCPATAVMAADGLGGFGGGRSTKEWLLAHRGRAHRGARLRLTVT
jgi:hypothetical protein